jgi:hypothetical protein
LILITVWNLFPFFSLLISQYDLMLSFVSIDTRYANIKNNAL